MHPFHRTSGRRGGDAPPQRADNRGAVLLEVVLALLLFVAAATIITSALSASVHEVERLRLNAHAANLAVTVLSELQMGLKSVEASGPSSFDPPFEQWTWQTTIEASTDTPGSMNPPQRVEVIVRHQSQSIVCRLTQFLPASMSAGSENGPSSSAPAPFNSTPAAAPVF